MQPQPKPRTIIVVYRDVEYRHTPRRFAAARRLWFRYRPGVFLFFGLAIIAGAIAVPIYRSPWPLDVTLRHYAARTNCAAARRVGLAPANVGQRGYWEKLDADHDGRSCEPYFGRNLYR